MYGSTHGCRIDKSGQLVKLTKHILLDATLLQLEKISRVVWTQAGFVGSESDDFGEHAFHSAPDNITRPAILQLLLRRKCDAVFDETHVKKWMTRLYSSG
jgi:hypothetical protein